MGVSPVNAHTAATAVCHLGPSDTLPRTGYRRFRQRTLGKRFPSYTQGTVRLVRLHAEAPVAPLSRPGRMPRPQRARRPRFVFVP